MTSAPRPNRWTFRVTPQSDDLVTRAALLLGTTKTAFVEESAVARAETVVAEQRPLVLSDDAFARFAEALEATPVAVPELVALFSRPSRLP